MHRKVFLSYSTDDTAIATTVRDYLEAQGIVRWMAPRDIVPGNDYGEQIIIAIEQASVLLLILSESSNTSTFVRHEVERAVAKGKVIIPFRIHPVQPSRSLEFFISNYQWIDGWETPLTSRWDALVQSIRSHVAGEVAHPETLLSQPQSASPTPPNNLPHHLTPFIGRETELAAIDELMSQAGVRLITILGPGGMGKTRLSLAVAQRHLADPRFVHGLYFVALAPISEVQHIVPTLMDALSLSVQPDASTRPQQQLLDYLRPKQMLLLFDNFEHLLDGAEMAAQILQAAPHVCILTTSRERLRVPGEHLFALQGLDYGRPIHKADADESAAVRLFVQSAQQVQPDLTLSAAEMAEVARICRLVGGMPLGIELAAAWSEVLTPSEIAGEIEQSLDFLEAEWRGGQEHHHSMRAVFDSTWQRLDAVEQALFIRLTIFRGGFLREAAEQITRASLRLLSALAGKSLIQHVHGRYMLHELLRQFGEGKLHAQHDAWTELLERHGGYYLRFLQQQGERLKGQEHLAALTAIEIELGNIRAAWNWAVAQRKVDEVELATGSLYNFYHMKFWHREGVDLFAKALASFAMEQPLGKQGVLYGKLLGRHAVMLAGMEAQIGGEGTKQKCLEQLRQGLAILNQLDAQKESAFILDNLGWIVFDVQRPAPGIELQKQALAIYEANDDRYGMRCALHDIGFLTFWSGDYRAAIVHFRQGMALCEQNGDLRTLGNILNMLGESHKALGEFAEAWQVVERGLVARKAVEEKRGIAWSLQLLGELAWHMGDYATAQQHSQASLLMFQEIGAVRTQSVALINLGNIAVSTGNHIQARRHFYAVLKPNLEERTALGDTHVAAALSGMAEMLIKEGKVREAAELLIHILHNPSAWQVIRERATKLLSELASSSPTQSLPDAASPPTRPWQVIVAEVMQA